MSHTDKEQINWQTEQISPEVQELRLAAQQGDAEAQFKLGKALVGYGKEIYQDEEEAIHWFRQAAEQGHIQAKYQLSRHLKNDESIFWLHQLAEQGYAEAQLDLAYTYREKDITQFIDWLRQAAEQEDTVNELTREFSGIESPQNRARFELGRIYESGKDGVAKDYEQAIFWYQKAVKHGSKWAKSSVEFLQAEIQYLGKCRQAAERGNAEAQYRLGREEEKLEHEEILEHHEKAVDWFQKAAEQGHIEAQFHLAQAYETGQGIAQNQKQAVYWYRQVAEREITEFEIDHTQFDLNQRKNETQENYEQRMTWYRQELKNIYAEAQFNLGYAYGSSEGISQDDKQAVDWYRKSAGNGHKRARFFLGCAYYDGQGVPQDYQQAVYWFQQAAQNIDLYREGDCLDEGDIDAQFNLACAYQKGEGIEQDDGKAVYWYAKVARKGDAEAQLQLGKLYDQAEITQDYEQLISWYRDLKRNHYASQYPFYPLESDERLINQRLAQEDQEKANYIKYKHLGGPKGYKKHLVSKCKKTATDWYQEAAKQGYSKALLYLGVQQTEKDSDEFIHWHCQLAINTILDNDEYDELELSEEDDEQAIASLRHQAEQGISVAQTVLAYLYKTGNAIPQDETKALFWFEKAAQQHDIVAQYWLGEMYFKALKFDKAQDYFQTASQNSHDGEYDELDMTKIESRAKDKLTLIQKYFHEQEKQRKIEEAKETANKQMLSFLTHTLNNSLGTAPEMVRQTIRLLSEHYQKDTAHYKAINNVISLFSTFSIVENLLQTFKQYIVEPEKFQLSWQTDNQGKGTIDLIIAFALRQTLSRIFFQLHQKLEELLPPNTEVTLKQLRQSFIDEVVALELNHQNAGQVVAWVKQNFDIFTLTLFNTQHIHFEENKTRFTFLFSVFSEIIFNALKYSDGQNPIKLVWTKEAETYYFTCSNSFNPNLRYREQGSQKGLVFIDKLMTMLKDSRLEHQEENNLFTVKLIFSKTHFEENA
ncbi:Sel1-like repeat [Beggiatoa sp. PS]|nr:Sel1-like repeat [Beggiatoa sp. PS]